MASRPGRRLGFMGFLISGGFLSREELGPLLDSLLASHIHSDNKTKLLIQYVGLNRLEEAREIVSRREKSGAPRPDSI
jgi:hypothetical protein